MSNEIELKQNKAVRLVAVGTAKRARDVNRANVRILMSDRREPEPHAIFRDL